MKKATATRLSSHDGIFCCYRGPHWPMRRASGANTAWILTSTALVLFMTLPGLALFLRRPGAQQERAVGPDAVFFHCRRRLDPVADRRLQPGVRRGQRLDR